MRRFHPQSLVTEWGVGCENMSRLLSVKIFFSWSYDFKYRNLYVNHLNDLIVIEDFRSVVWGNNRVHLTCWVKKLEFFIWVSFLSFGVFFFLNLHDWFNMGTEFISNKFICELLPTIWFPFIQYLYAVSLLHNRNIAIKSNLRLESGFLSPLAMQLHWKICWLH